MRDLSPFVDPLIEALATRGAFRPGPVVPTSVEEAYAVHAALMDAVGPVGGYKISQKPGRDPVVAPIPANRCFPSGAPVETPPQVGGELEIGFVVVEPIPSPTDRDFRNRLIEAVRPAPMIELVSSRIAGPLAKDAVVKLADLQACEALISGAPLASWTGEDFAEIRDDFRSEEGPIHSGTGKVPGGSALCALEETVRILGTRYGGLRPGQKVLTGTLVPLTPVRAGQTLTGRIDGLGEVTATLV